MAMDASDNGRHTHNHIFHYQRLSRPPLSLIPVYFLQMSSEIEKPCSRIPSLAEYCRRGQPFDMLRLLAFANPRPLSRDCPC